MILERAKEFIKEKELEVFGDDSEGDHEESEKEEAKERKQEPLPDQETVQEKTFNSATLNLEPIPREEAEIIYCGQKAAEIFYGYVAKGASESIAMDHVLNDVIPHLPEDVKKSQQLKFNLHFIIKYGAEYDVGTALSDSVRAPEEYWAKFDVNKPSYGRLNYAFEPIESPPKVEIFPNLYLFDEALIVRQLLILDVMQFANHLKQAPGAAAILFCMFHSAINGGLYEVEKRVSVGDNEYQIVNRKLSQLAIMFSIRFVKVKWFGTYYWRMFYTIDNSLERLPPYVSGIHWFDQIYNQFQNPAVIHLNCYQPDEYFEKSFAANARKRIPLTVPVPQPDAPMPAEYVVEPIYKKARGFWYFLLNFGLAVGAITLSSYVITTLIINLTKVLFGRGLQAHSEDENTGNKNAKVLKKRAPKRQIAKKKVVPSGPIKVVAQSSDATGSLATKIAHNTEFVTFVTKSGDKSRQFVTFVSGKTFVTSSHVFKLSEVNKLIFHWTKDENDGTIELSKDNFSVTYATDGRDLAIVTLLTEVLPMYKKLHRHLMTKETYPKSDVDGVVRLDFEQSGVLLLHQVPKSAPYFPEREVLVNFKGREMGFKHMWLARPMKNESGDCGLAYLTTNDKYQKKFLGIHVAGKGDGAFYTPVYLEDLPIETQSLEGQRLDIKALYPQNDVELIDYQVKEIIGMKTIGKLEKAGKPLVNFMPGETSIRPSLLQKPILFKGEEIKHSFVSTKVPAKLKPYRDGDEVVFPLKNALKRLEGRNTPPAPENFLESKHMKGIFHSNFDFEKIRKLELDEAINGVKGSKFLGPLDFTASSSLAFTEFGITTEKLFPIVAYSNHKPDPRFEKELQNHSQVDDTIRRTPIKPFLDLLYYRKTNYYDKGKVPPYACLGTLKDETKARGKENKPRLFANGMKAGLIEARMWFGTTFEQVVNHHGEGDVYIGINVHGFDWTALYKKLRSKSEHKIICDDIAAWDYNMRLSFVQAYTTELIRQQFPHEIIRHQEMILMSTLSPYILMSDKVYQYIGMPSGSYLTAMINSMYNSWKNRVLWDLVHPDKDFDEYLAQGVFGDDLIQSVANDLPEDAWNGQILAALRKQHFGIDTTSIFKDGRTVPKFCGHVGKPTNCIT